MVAEWAIYTTVRCCLLTYSSELKYFQSIHTCSSSSGTCLGRNFCFSLVLGSFLEGFSSEQDGMLTFSFL